MPDYKISLSPELDKDLKKIAAENSININQLLINAVSVYKNLKDNTGKEESVGILDENDNPVARVNVP